jgi:hypothetical protein
MTNGNHRRRRRKWPLAALGVTTGAALVAGGLGVADAATAPPALSFIAATKDVTAVRYVEGDSVYLDYDLGVNLIAGKDPFEIRATRTSYAKPISAVRIVPQGGKKKQVALPAGMVKSFGGLSAFSTVTIKTAAGATVKNFQTDFCPNSYGSTRTRRDAPAQNPYPMGCSAGNPFVLGGVWGIQAGWNAPIADRPQSTDPEGRDEFDIPAGKYAVTVTLNPAYQKFLKIPASGATVKLNLTVTTVADGGKGLAAARQKAERATVSTAHDQHLHAAEGNEAAQISDRLPEFRAPARRPAVTKVAPKTGPKPDLRSLPAWGISLEQGTDEKTEKPNGKWYVNFGATVWNAGTSPLLVDGFRRTGTELMDAYQYFFDAKGKQVGSVAAGTMQWDAREGHRHWHFTDFAQYNLLRADQKLAVRSGKEAFCLANTDAVDYTLPNAKWRPENTDLSTSCGGNTAVAVREVLDIGNGDTYSQARPGQSFEVTGLPNGTYYIQVKANPSNKLKELNTGNNTSLRKIILGGTKDKRTLTVPPVNGIQG